MRRLVLALLPLLSFVALLPLDNGGAKPPSVAAHGDVIPGRYIVVLESGANPYVEAASLGRKFDFKADGVYTRAVKGFTASMSATEARAVAAQPNVQLVEADQVVSTALHENNFQTLPTGINRVDGETLAAAGIGGPPGPDMDIDIAVIDSGIDVDHVDLRVSGGIRFLGDGCANGSHDDDYGHGSHVAGTIAAKDNSLGVVGIAPGARLWAVKILNSAGSGSTSCVIAGVDWVTARRAEFNDGAADGDPGIKIEVANMSLGGTNSPAMCTAIANATAVGVIVTAAAGNQALDGAGSSPGNCAAAVGVSAYADFDGLPGGLLDQTATFQICTETEDDSFACFSNFGSVVDIAAPGVNIVSTVPDGLYGFNSGTSMAAPHVAGAAALLKLGGYGGSAQGPSVVAALGANGWTRPQSAVCGFTGDPDAFMEPVLFLGSGCTAGTATPTPNPTLSPSPTVAPTPTASPSPSPTPQGCPSDTDCDGWPNLNEQFLGTSAFSDCPINTVPDDEAMDAWPPDLNDDRQVNTVDAGKFVGRLGQDATEPLYTTRLDLNQSGVISTVDVGSLVGTMGDSCS